MTIGAGWYLVHEIFVVFIRITEKAWGEEGAERGTKCFIPEFLLDKETV